MTGNPAKIIAALQSGANRTREISARTGIRVEIVQVRLAELAKRGAVNAYTMRSDGRHGRMPKFYRAASATIGSDT
jgi:predicted ArsR family transcriptional regulator